MEKELEKLEEYYFKSETVPCGTKSKNIRVLVEGIVLATSSSEAKDIACNLVIESFNGTRMIDSIVVTIKN